MNVPQATAGGAFDALSPDAVLEAVEGAFDVRLDGSLTPYSSYVNRVYGLAAEDGREFIAKFYRPGRWSHEAILEEHRFLEDCAGIEIPVVAPLLSTEGDSLPEIEIVPGTPENGGEQSAVFAFALFPKRGGRSFDAESDEDWLRIGRLAGRIHRAGAARASRHRVRLGPELARANLETIGPLIHPEFRAEFTELCASLIAESAADLEALPAQRIHGDLHRGNILERPGEGLHILDFDDMMTGPCVQDLWLLLPGRLEESRKELSALLEGYSEFAFLEPGSLSMVETLRFYRMLHFLAWRSLQRNDDWFRRDFPDWGGRAFWLRELEDFRSQAAVIADQRFTSDRL
jgi:Ser/Thr protein kinase RdoA (MazF antagonist)